MIKFFFKGAKAASVLLFVIFLLSSFIPHIRENLHFTFMTRLLVSNATALQLPKLPHSNTWIEGLVLYRSGNEEAGITMMESAVNNHADARISTEFLLASALYESGKTADAGHVLWKTGILTQLTGLSIANQLGAVYTDEQINKIFDAGLALANLMLDQNRFHDAEKIISTIADLSQYIDKERSAQNYMLLARQQQLVGDKREAIAFIRQSLDVLPPLASSDARYNLLLRSAIDYLRDDGCKVSRKNLQIALLVLYKFDQGSSLDSDCIDDIQTSLRPFISSIEHAYVLRNEAFVHHRHGRLKQAQKLLMDAEQLGLPSVWRHVLNKSNNTVDLSAAHPKYVLNDSVYMGYEVDPIQVELGIPLDVLLYKKSDSLQKVELKLFTGINLAPNSGFEFFANDQCSFVNCQPLGFANDIYNANDSRALKVKEQSTILERPLLPGEDGDVIETNVMGLNNQILPVKNDLLPSSSLESFPRTITSKKLLLGSWINSTEDGNGFIGIRWFDTIRQPPYEYAVGAYNTNQWTYHSRIIEAPTDAKNLALWLLNFRASGIVWFDGVIMIELPDD